MGAAWATAFGSVSVALITAVTAFFTQWWTTKARRDELTDQHKAEIERLELARRHETQAEMRQDRKARIHEWREGISTAAANTLDTAVANQTWYLSLQPHVLNKTGIEAFVKAVRLGEIGVVLLSDEVDRIEQQWELL